MFNNQTRYPQSLRAFLDGDFSLGFHSFEPYTDALIQAFDHQLETYSRRFEANEKDGVVTYSLVLPGFKQSEVDVQLDKGLLTVKAESGTREVEQSLSVGSNIDSNRIGAKLENGILTVTLVRLEPTNPRKIVVS